MLFALDRHYSVAYTLVLVVTTTMIAQLFFFHVNLQRQGISTFDYVVADARKQQAKEKEEGELRHKRLKDEEKRKAEGQTQLCGVCWVGGKSKQAKPSSVVDPAEAQGEVDEEAGGKFSVEMADVSVRDEDHENEETQ